MLSEIKGDINAIYRWHNFHSRQPLENKNEINKKLEIRKQ
jgi:hypothetical protein